MAGFSTRRALERSVLGALALACDSVYGIQFGDSRSIRTGLLYSNGDLDCDAVCMGTSQVEFGLAVCAAARVAQCNHSSVLRWHHCRSGTYEILHDRIWNRAGNSDGSDCG